MVFQVERGVCDEDRAVVGLYAPCVAFAIWQGLLLKRDTPALWGCITNSLPPVFRSACSSSGVADRTGVINARVNALLVVKHLDVVEQRQAYVLAEMN